VRERTEYRDVGQVSSAPDYELTVHIIEISSGHTLCGQEPTIGSEEWLFGPDDSTLSDDDLRRLFEQEDVCPRCREMLVTSGLVDPSRATERKESTGQYTAFTKVSHDGSLIVHIAESDNKHRTLCGNATGGTPWSSKMLERPERYGPFTTEELLVIDQHERCHVCRHCLRVLKSRGFVETEFP